MLPARRVVLLSCRSPFLDDDKVYCPLANLYLKSYINTHLPEIDVTVAGDSYDLHDTSWLDGIDTVGISIMTPQRVEAIRIASSIKRTAPDVTVIAGGPHVKHYTHELTANDCFDYLVPFDGEKALAEILNGRASGRVVPSVLTRQEIADQPRPDRTSPNARAILSQYRYVLNGREATTMMTARGCPERCTFCEEALTAVRWTSIGNIRAELDDIVELGYRAVYIFDDLFAISLPTIRPICAELQTRGLIYRCNAQARYFTKWGDQMAALLADTGCYEIAFGAESGSQKILDTVGKRCTVEQNYQTVALAKSHGLVVKAFILIGLPGEDRDTLRETESFIRDSGIDDFQCAVYMPFRGTQIRAALERGEDLDLHVEPQGADGDVSGAYVTAHGESAYEVHTDCLSRDDIRAFRDHLLRQYKPASHRARWTAEDKFFDSYAPELDADDALLCQPPIPAAPSPTQPLIAPRRG